MKRTDDGVVTYDNVVIGEDAVLEGPCIIGKPPRGKTDGELATVIGSHCVIRPFTTVYSGCSIGDNFQTGQGASIREDNVIGDQVSIGTNAVLEHGNQIGNNVRIHTGCFLEMTTVESGVFVGPNVVCTDDPHPPCPEYQRCVGGPVIKANAKIGGNSTILPGVVIGRSALVGAGAVVTHDVAAETVVAGSPARQIKKIGDLRCHRGLVTDPYVWETE